LPPGVAPRRSAAHSPSAHPSQCARTLDITGVTELLGVDYRPSRRRLGAEQSIEDADGLTGLSRTGLAQPCREDHSRPAIRRCDGSCAGGSHWREHLSRCRRRKRVAPGVMDASPRSRRATRRSRTWTLVSNATGEGPCVDASSTTLFHAESWIKTGGPPSRQGLKL